MFTIIDIDHTCAPNLGGLIKEILVSHESDIDSIPAKIAGGITITGSIVMKTAKSFAKLAIVGDAQLKGDPQGTVQAQSQKTTVTFKLNGMNDQTGFVATELQNSRLVLLCKDANGTWWVVGSQDRPAMWKCSADTGANATVGTSYNIEVTADSYNGALIYAGTCPPPVGP